MNGTVFDIQRFCVHDGPGIRTTVFLKGCPLRCAWCHNPEGISPKNSLRIFYEKCIGCAACVDVCPTAAHSIDGAGKLFERQKCISCFACTEVCPSGALIPTAKEYTAQMIADAVLRDKVFYRKEGGVTLSGGEALMQADFCREILSLCKAAGVSTAIDTCGYVPFEEIEKTLEYTDIYIWDIKAYDRELHKKGCGVYNDIILENFKKLDGKGKRISVRVPVIGSFNDSVHEMESIADTVADNKSVCDVTLMPYHSFGGAKYETLGMRYGIWEGADVSEEKIESLREIFRRRGIKVI